jgi:hypothetical protein
MMTLQELNDLVNKKKSMIDSFHQAKRSRVYEIVEIKIKLLKRHKKLADQMDDDQNTSLAMNDALTNLRDLDRQINAAATELGNLLNENESINTSRDPSDAGTIGGNGWVIFRTFGKQFYVPKGTLTQDQILAERNK